MRKKNIFLSLFIVFSLLSLTACGASSAAKFTWKLPKDAVETNITNSTWTSVSSLTVLNNDFAVVKFAKFVNRTTLSSGKEIFAVSMSCENKSDKQLTFYWNNLSLNAYLVADGGPVSEVNVAPGGKGTLIAWGYCTDLPTGMSGLFDSKTVEYTLNVYETSTGNVVVYKTGEEPPETMSAHADIVIYNQGQSAKSIDFSSDRTPLSDEQTLVNDENITAIATWFGYDEKKAAITLNMYLENKTDKSLIYELTNITIDGVAIKDYDKKVLPTSSRYEFKGGSFVNEKMTYVTTAEKLTCTLVIKNNANSEVIKEYKNIVITPIKGTQAKTK